eukprot:Phypoly_transcript_22691.p1 GENE.Phypoly_transcript_22691~~Phypoly_transcript_22691.p1  ORF type:complete len:186 (+),score=13.66 Phypoly_transcript_22691:42-560(+)
MNSRIAFIVIILSFVSVASCAYELRLYLTFIGTSSTNSTGIVRAKAQSQISTTLIDNEYGFRHAERQFKGPTAAWVSVYTSTTEAGNITFGVDSAPGRTHIINFERVATQNIVNWHNFQHGAAYYNVTGGQGAFAGADGLLSSTYTLDPTNLYNIQRVTGSLWLQGNPPQAF